MHAYNDLNLTLSQGAYGATFYMLTGFHGFHVTLGTVMLIVILFRCIKGHLLQISILVLKVLLGIGTLLMWYGYFYFFSILDIVYSINPSLKPSIKDKNKSTEKKTLKVNDFTIFSELLLSLTKKNRPENKVLNIKTSSVIIKVILIINNQLEPIN